MARVLMITNPAAARTRPSVVARISGALRTQGWVVDVAETTSPGEAAELASGTADVDVIAVYGGDGTTMQVVRGMIGKEIPLGLIPGGTGNLLAGNLRLPRSPEKAARLITTGQARRIDLGVIERPEGTRYFAVASGTGYDAELMAQTAAVEKRKWGFGAYIAKAAATLSNVETVAHRITVDGVVSEAEGTTLLVANCGEFIPRVLRLRRGIRLDDGKLDVVVLRANGLFEAAGVVFQLLTGSAEHSPRVRYLRGRSITVETDGPRPVQMDGEEAGVTPFTANVMPGALKILVPSNRSY
ncbi:MAG: diacylglycerol kinase family protein [Gemmatimonadales bacterium]